MKPIIRRGSRIKRGPMLVALLGGCATSPAAPPPAALEGACVAAVAAHVARPAAEVTARPAGQTAGGLTLIEVTDAGQGGDRTHVCEVEEGGRVRALRHPPS